MPYQIAGEIVGIEPVELRRNVRFAVDAAVPELHDGRVDVLWDRVAANCDSVHSERGVRRVMVVV